MTTTAMPPALPAANGNGGGAMTDKQKSLTLQDLLLKKRDLIADVLPRHMTPERLIKLATVAVSRVPKLGQATGLSVVNAIIKAAELGLDCSGTLGSAYLVPFENNKKVNGRWTKTVEAQLIIGYRGLIDLARRSGQIASIEARVVWKNDVFEFEYGLEPRLKHVPALDKEPGDFRLVYAIAKLRDGAMQLEVMTKAEVDSIRERSQSGKRKDRYDNGQRTGETYYDEKSPWATDYPEMARKTVVKRLCKYLPLSVEMQEAIAIDNDADPIDLVDGQLVQPNAAERLNAKVTGKPLSAGQTLADDDGNTLAESDEDPTGDLTPDQEDQAELRSHDFARPGADASESKEPEGVADKAEEHVELPAEQAQTPEITPREKFMVQVQEALSAEGIAWDESAVKAVAKWALGAGEKNAKGFGTSVVNKEHEATAEAKKALFESIMQRRGNFSYAAQ